MFLLRINEAPRIPFTLQSTEPGVSQTQEVWSFYIRMLMWYICCWCMYLMCWSNKCEGGQHSQYWIIGTFATLATATLLHVAMAQQWAMYVTLQVYSRDTYFLNCLNYVLGWFRTNVLENIPTAPSIRYNILITRKGCTVSPALYIASNGTTLGLDTVAALKLQIDRFTKQLHGGSIWVDRDWDHHQEWVSVVIVSRIGICAWLHVPSRDLEKHSGSF